MTDTPDATAAGQHDWLVWWDHGPSEPIEVTAMTPQHAAKAAVEANPHRTLAAVTPTST
jgi:hypothetical protein